MSEQQEQAKVAMVIFAHPDDAEFGAAGTAAKWVSEGWTVYYVVLTDAVGGGPDDATDVGPEARRQVAETRKREQRAAAAVLGLKDVIFLDYPDGRLQPTIELRRDIVRLLRKYRPTRVICQSPERTWVPTMAIGRYHPDHLASGQAVVSALYPASQNPWDFPELMDEGLLPHKVKELYIMGAPHANYFVDVSDVMEQKMKALLCHESQFIGRIGDIEKIMRARSGDIGKKYWVAFAEEFHRTENF